MQTILGAGGVIGQELAKNLEQYTAKVRLVSRNPKSVTGNEELFGTDLSRAEQVDKAVEGSEIAYLTAGLNYSKKVWQKSWPLIMANVLNACEKHGCKLVFFDNIYMYDANSLSDIREDNPVNPPSEKGKVRAEIARMVMDTHQRGKIKTMIARAADFYGPGIQNVSLLTESVFKPLSQGKKAQVIGRLDVKHAFTYTPDAGKAVALLGNTEDAYGEIWHLPTHSENMTMQQWVDAIAKELGVEPKVQAANKTVLKIIGLFNPILREFVEMYYQYDRDYNFNSTKFEKRFGFKATAYPEGIREIVRSDYK